MDLKCETCGKVVRMQTSPGGSRWVHRDLVNLDGHEVYPAEVTPETPARKIPDAVVVDTGGTWRKALADIAGAWHAEARALRDSGITDLQRGRAVQLERDAARLSALAADGLPATCERTASCTYPAGHREGCTPPR